MKKSIIYTALLFAFLHFNNASKGQNQLLIKSIVYDVPIYSASYYPENEGVEVWVNNNLEPSKRCFLQQNIINKVVNGKLEVYNELGKKLSKTEVDKILVSKDTILRSRWEPPYSTYDTVLDVVMPSYRINYLRFHESWYYDMKSFKIKKVISEYAPLIVNLIESGSYKVGDRIPLFWIKCGNKILKTDEIVLLSDLISSTSSFISSEKNLEPARYTCISISNDTINRLNYLSSLLTSASNGSVKVKGWMAIENFYDFTFDTVIEMKPSEVDEFLNARHNVVTNKIERINENDMEGIVFFEKWYINKRTMEIQKKIVTVKPYLPSFDDTWKYRGNRCVFELLFMKPFRCF